MDLCALQLLRSGKAGKMVRASMLNVSEKLFSLSPLIVPERLHDFQGTSCVLELAPPWVTGRPELDVFSCNVVKVAIGPQSEIFYFDLAAYLVACEITRFGHNVVAVADKGSAAGAYLQIVFNDGNVMRLSRLVTDAFPQADVRSWNPTTLRETLLGFSRGRRVSSAARKVALSAAENAARKRLDGEQAEKLVREYLSNLRRLFAHHNEVRKVCLRMLALGCVI